MRRWGFAVLSAVLCGLVLTGCGAKEIKPDQAFSTARDELGSASSAKVDFNLESGELRLAGQAQETYAGGTDLSAHFDVSRPVLVDDAIVVDQNTWLRRSGSDTWTAASVAASPLTPTQRQPAGNLDLLDPMRFLKLGIQGWNTLQQDDPSHPGTHYKTTCMFSVPGQGCSISDLGSLGVSFPDTSQMDLDLWLDDKGMPTYLQAKVPAPYNARVVMASGPVTVTMAFSDYGKPVTITKPARTG